MTSGRVVDALDTTDKNYLRWKMRFKAAAGAFEQGKLEEARRLMFRVLYHADTLDEKSFTVPASNLALAILSMEQGKMEESKSFFDKGLRGAAARPDGAGQQLYAAGLRYLAAWHERNGSLEEAEAKVRESVAVLEKLNDCDVQLAYSLSDLCFILVRRGKTEEVHRIILRAMQLLSSTVGKEHPQYDFAKMLFEVCVNHNDEKTLIETFEMSATKLQYKVGSRYPNLVRALNAYAEALKERGLTYELGEAKEKFASLMRASAKS